MRTAMLIRTSSSDEGTFGKIILDDGTEYFTGELPWKDNQKGMSCIPSGVYECEVINSPSHGRVYLIKNVPDRSMCEIHSANWMGDKSKGFKYQLEGCIALGLDCRLLEGQMAVIASKVAVSGLMKIFNSQPFQLTIKWKDESYVIQSRKRS